VGSTQLSSAQLSLGSAHRKSTWIGVAFFVRAGGLLRRECVTVETTLLTISIIVIITNYSLCIDIARTTNYVPMQSAIGVHTEKVPSSLALASEPTYAASPEV
jgi:hypothetical protein